ncbi:MAG: hypothetical protein RR444_13440, partial [Oscillospiraceae bacterium]
LSQGQSGVNTEDMQAGETMRLLHRRTKGRQTVTKSLIGCTDSVTVCESYSVNAYMTGCHHYCVTTPSYIRTYTED